MKSHNFSLFIVLAFWVSCASRALRADAASEAGPFRVLSYNVYYGFTKIPERKPGTVAWIREQKPDLAVFQELNSYTHGRLQEDALQWGHEHSVLLKEDGFPVGITSRHPLEDVQKVREGFHHGLIRAKVQGITLYAVHLHPSNWETRHREIDWILKDIQSLPTDARILIIGDFNSLSRLDATHYASSNLVPFFHERDLKYREKNLREGDLDFLALDRLYEAGLVDLEHRFRPPAAPFYGSFPTDILKPGPDGEARRLDYALASATLAKTCTGARIIRDARTLTQSDHLPLVIDFQIKR